MDEKVNQLMALLEEGAEKFDGEKEDEFFDFVNDAVRDAKPTSQGEVKVLEPQGQGQSSSKVKRLGAHPGIPSSLYDPNFSKTLDYEHDGGYTNILLLSLITLLAEVFFIIFAVVMYK